MKRPYLSKPTEGERIDPFSLSYVRARNKNSAHSFVLDKLAASGKTKADLARMLGKQPSQISRWLGGAGNITVDTLSDLMFAINGELFELQAADPFDGGRSNHQLNAAYLDFRVRPKQRLHANPKTVSVSTRKEESAYVKA